ncbi:hypothetical protein RRG08_003519 [Elysia crispata]|uniref:Uncharacterized protein n=1 Tax=Elysia crispata TaxID=231223 RepID=A0AAE0Y6C9_9GAST|nr:hypothetical protein RRG08_003519 [Elysia crispata]
MAASARILLLASLIAVTVNTSPALDNHPEFSLKVAQNYPAKPEQSQLCAVGWNRRDAVNGPRPHGEQLNIVDTALSLSARVYQSNTVLKELGCHSSGSLDSCSKAPLFSLTRCSP